MSTEICLICDQCGKVLAGAGSVKQMREDAKTLFTRLGGKDICIECRPLRYKVLKSLHKALAILDTDPADNANPFRTTP